MPLNYTNSIPLHVQLKKIIHQNIIAGKFTERIPSERELMDMFYVSRSTVRQAISQLVHERILEKRPGKGTFVVTKPITNWLGDLATTTEVIEKIGMQASVTLHKSEIIPLYGELQQITGLDKAYLFERIRFANHIAVGIERSLFPLDIGGKLNNYNLDQVSFYDLLESEIGIKALSAQQQITAGSFSTEDAELLHIPKKSIYIQAKRTITDHEEKFIEYERAYYRADMYSFEISLSRQQ